MRRMIWLAVNYTVHMQILFVLFRKSCYGSNLTAWKDSQPFDSFFLCNNTEVVFQTVTPDVFQGLIPGEISLAYTILMCSIKETKMESKIAY